MPLLNLAMLACKEADRIAIPGRSGGLEVALVNPTSCSGCDPFDDLDTLRVDVVRDGVVVASDSFSWPDQEPVIPSLDELGVVRIHLAGLSEGRVVSGGRTAEVALDPEAELTIPLVFLPVNRALALTEQMVDARSRHVAVPWRDGRILLAGGLDPERTLSFRSSELYDPSTGTFGAGAGDLPEAVADPAVVPFQAGQTLLLGGEVQLPDRDPAAGATVALVDEDEASITELTLLSEARSGGCVSPFSERAEMYFGGNAAAAGATYVHKLGEEEGWESTTIRMEDFDQTDIRGCAVLDDGTTLLLGTTAANTGIWSYTEDSTREMGAAFRPLTAGEPPYTDGPLVQRLPNGDVWIVGGVDTLGELDPFGHVFRQSSSKFGEATFLERPRYQPRAAAWIEEGWFAVGCGWRDGGRDQAESSVELLNPDSAEAVEAIALDRERDGCAVSVAPDGSILVSGGFDSATANGASAAVVVPWRDGD
jgi:hypothetical protein